MYPIILSDAAQKTVPLPIAFTPHICYLNDAG